MPTVLRITQQKKHPHRYNLFLDNEERISITDDMILKYHLSTGVELDGAQLDRIMRDADRVFTREKALELLALRDHAGGELRTKLLQKGYDKHIIPEVIAYLESKGYLDDRRFAESYAGELTGVKRLGSRKVREKLFQRGVDSGVIREVLDSFDAEREAENCRYHYRKKKRTLPGKDEKKEQQKLIRFLQGKGFGWNVIARVMGEDRESD
jgi:regulatory protein